MKKMLFLLVMILLFGCVSQNHKGRDIAREFLCVTNNFSAEPTREAQEVIDVFASAIETYLTNDEIDDLRNVITDPTIKSLVRQAQEMPSNENTVKLRNAIDRKARTEALRKISGVEFRRLFAEKLNLKYPNISGITDKLIDLSE